MSANDVRTSEDMNTFEGGDDYLTPLNMVAVPEGQEPPPPAPATPPLVAAPNPPELVN